LEIRGGVGRYCVFDEFGELIAEEAGERLVGVSLVV
jgi:hypothetical protein